MMRGKVMGSVWGTKMSPLLQGLRLLMVTPTDATGALLPGGRVVVAVDPVGARSGQEVLVAFGSGGRNALRPGPGNRRSVVDASVVEIVDSWRVDESLTGPQEG